MVRPESNLSIKWFKSQAFGVLGHNRADSVVLSVKAFWYLAIISGGSGAQLVPLGVGWLGGGPSICRKLQHAGRIFEGG